MSSQQTEITLEAQSDEARAAREKEAADIAAQFDAESRTRTLRSRPLVWFVTLFAAFVAIYHMYTAYFGGPPTLIHRSLHVSAMLFLIFLLYPPVKRAKGRTWQLIDVVLALASLVPTIYMVANYETLVLQAGRFTSQDVIIATLFVVLVLEAARRVSGWALPLLSILFVLFGYFGRDLPGTLRHRGFDWDQMAYSFYATTEGIFGTAIGVSATYIILFIIFGAVLNRSGMSMLFNDLAMAIAGMSRGGPAKVATIASGFMGSINGSAIANVVSTGAFTIPMMKKIGYTKNFAGAVESTASVGGQILPPVMGAVAFIMAETLGVPYTTVAVAAIVPALLYYISLIIQIHLRATRMGLKGVSRDSLPGVMEVLKERGHLLIPLLFLIYMLFFSGRTILYSALLTIIVTIVVAMLRKTTRMSLRDIIGALEDGTRQTLGVAAACACVGIIVGVVSLSGFGVKLSGAIVALAGGTLFFTLLFTMVACLILGMGLPSIPAYIITATMAAPALTELGVEPIVVHLFVFYFGLFANITPPVALAAFAAAGISGGNPMSTGFSAIRLAVAGFVIPYIFVYSPELLLRDVGFLEGLMVVVTALIGITLLCIANEFYFMVKLPWYLAILLVAAAILLLNSDWILSLIGLAAGVVVLGIQMMRAKAQGMLSIKNI